METRLTPLVCNHCGAPLAVPDDVRFVTCQHCQTNLSVEQHGGTIFTRDLERVAEKTDRIGERVAEMHAAMRREKLDEQWEQQRKQYMTELPDGTYAVPKAIDAVQFSIGMSIFGLIGFAIAVAVIPMSIGLACLLLGLGVIALAVMLSNVGEANHRAREYESALREYERLCEQIEREAKLEAESH